jgi:tetratricopeptide (TPR) repeat protein
VENPAAILITGEEGSGKTALLCHWFVNRFGNIPVPTLLTDGWIFRRTSGLPSAPQSETGLKWLYHFVGASGDSHSTLRLVRRWTQLLFWELKRDQPVPETPREARGAFLGALREIAERYKVLLLIDGIDQLIAEDPVLRNLYWLPLTEHPNIHLIASCRPGPGAQSLKQPFQSLELRTLRSWERSRLVEHLLYEDQARRLPRRLVSHIAKSAVGAAPRRLTALCEELNAVGKHETLATQIEHYLEQPGETEFYLQVFNRLIAQYQAGEEGLVRELLTLIAVSRLGLNESELQGISPQIRDAASSLDWVSTLSAVSHLLTRHGPQWQLPEGAVVNAVYRRWMPGPHEQATRRFRLVEYFTEQPVSPRMIDELPWHLVLVGRFSELKSRLLDLAFLVPAWQRRASDVRLYWGELKRHTGQSVQTAYRHHLDDPNLGPQEAWVICRLLQATGFASTALDFGRAALAFPEFAHSQDALLAYGVVVELASQLGAWEAAEQALVDYDKLARQWGDAVLSVRGGLLRGGILRMRGDSAKAVSMLQQVAQDLMAVNDVYSAAAAMGIAGQALFDLKHYQQALVHFENQLRYGEQLGDIDLIRNGLSNRNGILIVLSRYAEALSGIKREQQICETLGDRQGLADCLSNRAVALLEMAQYDDAMHTLDEVERLYTELCNPLGVAQTRLRQAYLFGIKLGQRHYALPIALEGCELAHQSGDALLEDRFQRLLAELTNH